MQIISYERLHEAFPPEIMPDAPLVNSTLGTEPEDATRVFRGKRWDELRAKDFNYTTTDMCFLETAWERYYLPAVISCSMAELQAEGKLIDTSIAVDHIFLRIDSYTYPACHAVSNLRGEFSLPQAQIIRDWVYAILLQTGDLSDSADHLITFLEAYIESAS